MKILVCGGAGYIGSHMCKLLARSGHEPVTFDNLSTGHEWAVKWGPLVRGDLLDPAALRRVFDAHAFDAVMHFAARSIVSESMQDPGLYFRNNVTGTLNLLDAMRTAGVKKLVFSSSAAVYGNPQYTPIDEAHPCAPINPYGWSKLMAERAIEEYCRAYAMRAVSLRYFNAAGADSEGEIGEAHEPETHLIPNVIRAMLDSTSAHVRIYGSDYDTPDGTCVRDYVHVEDLCTAHLSAIAYLKRVGGFHAFNLGSGTGKSVAEVIAECKAQWGKPQADTHPRRVGDPPILVATSARAATALEWTARLELRECLQSTLHWFQLHR